MIPVLTTNMLTKVYGEKLVLKGVNINIYKGDIYGLIGRNGAGKSTLIRTILGLSLQDEGRYDFFGGEEANLARRKVGSLVEAPSFHPDLSARDNLEIVRLALGIEEKNVIQELLDMVGLGKTRKKRMKFFSLGMKQRFAIAVALMGKPSFVILDEPTNGLDPEGIKDIRQLISYLNQKFGITFLISSHILSELSKLATRYGIIENGELIDEFTSQELDHRVRPSLIVKVDNIQKAAEVIEKDLETKNYKIIDKDTLELFDKCDSAGEVNKILSSNDITVEAISKNRVDLEDYFLKVIEIKRKEG